VVVRFCAVRRSERAKTQIRADRATVTCAPARCRTRRPGQVSLEGQPVRLNTSTMRQVSTSASVFEQLDRLAGEDHRHELDPGGRSAWFAS
jgi:hypothetical protein